MRLRVTASTDEKYLGEVVDVPSTALGQMSKAEVQAFARATYDFVPDVILYSHNGAAVRLVNSNYSVSLEVIDDG